MVPCWDTRESPPLYFSVKVSMFLNGKYLLESYMSISQKLLFQCFYRIKKHKCDQILSKLSQLISLDGNFSQLMLAQSASLFQTDTPYLLSGRFGRSWFPNGKTGDQKQQSDAFYSANKAQETI